MILRSLITLMVFISIGNSSNYVFSTTGEFHNEQYTTDGESNNYSSLGVTADLKYFGENDLDIFAGGKAYYNYSKEDKNEVYTDLKNEAVITEFSFQKTFSTSSFSMGRNSINLPLLRGSFDGALGFFIYDSFSLRVFGFDKYTIRSSAFSETIKDIDLQGINLGYEDEKNNLKIFGFQDANGDYYGLKYTVNFSTSYSLNYENHNFKDDSIKERISKIFFEKKFESVDLELGYIENLGDRIFNLNQYNNEDTNQFSLGSLIYLEKSYNGYLQGKYFTKDSMVKLLLGRTIYRNHLSRDLESLEIEASYIKLFSNDFYLKTGYFSSTVDNIDTMNDSASYLYFSGGKKF
ncbi:MAG: hypothetical protein OIF32_07810 [Campylobacterales bacterium]|nr:hypothetical protein [Campylobacterales bacterium]